MRQLFHRPENLGFGKSHNLAFKLLSKKTKYHLIINPDIFFKKDILKDLVDFMEKNKKAGAVSPQILYPSGNYQRLQKLLPSPYGWFLRRFRKQSNALKKFNYNFELRMAPRNAVYKYPYMSGCFMLLRNSVIDKINLFDENIFMYCEDTDLSRRLWINKTPPFYYGNVKVFHHFAKDSHNSLKLLIIAIKSTIYYFNKWGWIDGKRKEINNECLRQFSNN